MPDTAPTLTAGTTTYAWQENWAVIPEPLQGKDNRRTHGIAVSPATGNLIVFHQAEPAVLIYSPQGQLLSRWGNGFLGAHGLTLVIEDGLERLWLTDQHSGQVVKTTLDGTLLQSIGKPQTPAYQGGKGYSPTWVAVDQAAGDVWVTDGYGQGLVHRHDRAGRYLGSIDGTETGALGRFNCPHGIGFNPKNELVIADRGNQRLQIYDRSGRFLRGVSGVFHSPCAFDFLGDLMLVPELRTGVKLVRNDAEVLANLGDHSEVTSVPGWPNLADTSHVKPGRFNSPHGACFSPSGDIFVAEWIIGGRITKLVRQQP